MICKRGWKGQVVFTALLALSLLFSAAVAAATVDDVVNNSLRIGDDVYELNRTTGYTYENVLASLDRGGANYYFKIDHRWYDLTRDDINTLSDLLDLEKAVPAAEVRTWVLDYRYGAGDTREELSPLASTYIFDYSLLDAAVLEAEDTEVTVDLRINELGAVGYDAAQIAFSAAGPGDVTFRMSEAVGEHTFENEGCLDAFALPAEYAGSMKWTLCFSSVGDYTVTFELVEQGTGKVIARVVREIRVYPSAENVLADLEARTLTALGTLEPEGSGVSGVDYAAGEALVCIDQPDLLVHRFVQSLVTAFKGPLDDVSVAAFYVGSEKIGAIEDPAAMSDVGLIAAIGRELIEPLIGGEQSWSEAALGDLEGKSAAVELTVALGAARYRAVYGVNFAINRYSVSVDSPNGTVEGAGSYAVGAEVGLEATAGAGYEFYIWSDGAGEEVGRSNPYTLTMPNRDLELTANFFRSVATVEQDSTLDESYIRVDVEGENITLDLGGNTVVHLSITGSNVVLQNGTVINLQIGRDVENVVLKDISDEAGSSHIFAGGGSGSIILEGHTVLKGTVQITSRTALGICSRSADSMIGGDIVVETIMPVAIAAPVQGEIRMLASSETLAVNAEVSRITALADAVIKISSAIDESKRPQVEKAAGVEVTVSIVDEQGEETVETEDVEEGAGLSPAAIFIFSIAPVADEIKVGRSYALPAAVQAVLSDRSTADVPVEWYPAAADTGEAGVYPFSGTVEGYEEAVVLTLTVYRTHLVFFETAGGSAVDEQEVRHGEAAVEPAAPDREGYIFGGWFKDEALGHPWNFDEERVTGALTLYARWTANIYEVTFDAKGGEGPSPASKDVTHDSAYGKLAVTAREGYTFAGWFTEADGGIKITAADRVSTAGDHTLYAHWDINQYTITFDSAGGSEIGPLTQDFGTAITAPAEPVKTGYYFMGWLPALPVTMPAEDLLLTAQWSIKTYTVTFLDHDGSLIGTQIVEHGSAAEAPIDPEREGYTFTGWDTYFAEVKSDLTVTAKYIDQLLVGIRDLIASNGDRTRADYTYGIAEWDNYWSSFCMALTDAGQLYAGLKDAETLTEEQRSSVIAAEEELQRAVEIIDGIEDFDLALSGREHPKGLVETVYERSLVSDEFQPGRIRCCYERESGKFYWMLSGFVQEQGLYEGTTGTGMNPGLQNVMLSESIVKLQSGEHVVNIYKADGTRKTRTELENSGITLATYWLTEANIKPWIYKSLVGLVEDCKLIGRTSDGVEFKRTYSFRFVDGGTYLFDPHFRYCVIDDLVQKDFEGYSMINVTRGLKYTGGTIQAAVDEADPGDYIHVAAGNYNESIIINKSINLIGNYREGIGAHATILDGAGIDGAHGIRIAEGVSNVLISGFEIADFASGGIVGEGSGISNITIEDNFIHDVGGNAIHGGSDISEASAGWTVAGNKIEEFGGSGVTFENIGGLLISDNSITGPAGADGFAIGITARADSGTMNMFGITITGNEITGGAINVTALAAGSGTAEVKNVDINENTIVGGSVEVQSGAEGGRTARIDHVSINDNHIDFQDRAVNVGTLAYPGNAHIKFITIKNNEMTGNATAIDLTPESGYSNMREFAITGNNLTITDPDSSGCAVNLTGAKGSDNFPNNFTNNTVTVVGSADVAFDGINISGRDTVIWNLTGNKVIGSNVGADSSGIRLGGDLPKVTVNVEKNTITGWRQGIQAGSLVADSAVKIQRNLIHGNTDYGVANGSGATIDAALNYWGHASGPEHDTNPGGQGNAVTNNVDFDPWYLDEDFADRSDGAVHNAKLNKYYREIQAAVDDAAPGDTIKVKTGLFNEGVTINKSITLIGVKGDSKTAGPGANAPIIDGAGLGDNVSGILISGDARNVVIEGFEIRNFTGAGASGVVGHGDMLSNVTIRYNYIQQVTGSGVDVTNAGGAVAAGWSVAYNKIENAGDSGIHFDGLHTDGDGAAEWLIDDNVLDGNGFGSAGFRCTDVSTSSTRIEMNRNTVIGWTCGVWILADDIAVTLRSNLIYNNSSWGVSSEESYVDANLNYWGHEDGPLGGSNGGGIAGTVSYEPWYIDEGCTVESDEGTIDQLQVDAAIALVPAKIASVEVPGGNSASAEEKIAAVKAYIENLEGMAILRVTVTVEAGSSSGYKVTVSKGDAIPGIRDNAQVTKFIIPPADQAAADIVAGLIASLPLATNVDIENYPTYLAAIEEAEAAYNALTEPQKTILGPYFGDKLNDLVDLIEELVLEELDGRIDDAIAELNFADSGIGGAQLFERKATLFVDDPYEKVHKFVESGVVYLFESMFQDVVGMRLGDDPTWYGVEGTTAGGIEAGAQIVSVLLGIPYQYGQSFGGVFNELAAAELYELIGESLNIEVKIQRVEGGKEYSGVYIIEFVETE